MNLGRPTSTINQLKQRYEANERQATEAARRRIQNSPGGLGDADGSLRQTVAEAFALRQELHRAELAEFEQRMATVQRTIQTREQIKDQIIKRRVQDLLNPTLNWDASKDRESGQSTSPTMPATP